LSKQRAASPVRRPDSARPRGEPEVEVEPPSPAELAAIQRHLATLPALEGGTVRELPELDVTLVEGDGHGLDGSYAAMPRWTAETWQAGLRAVRDLMRADGVWPRSSGATVDRPIA
jgi:hypothetical protein